MHAMSGFLRRAALAALAALSAAALAGCIADTAADRDLPWATNQTWEGMMPMPGGFNSYD